MCLWENHKGNLILSRYNDFLQAEKNHRICLIKINDHTSKSYVLILLNTPVLSIKSYSNSDYTQMYDNEFFFRDISLKF